MSDNNKLVTELAHELRGPLAPIANGIQILKLHGPSLEVIAMMERQMKQVTGTLDRLLRRCTLFWFSLIWKSARSS
jgi:signal transduction histidine kinase